ncbi:hypothetical protein SESBI_01767 [Sesbania bispinosa]|nr:hypothetical protein SESBI_01767 [Sesbania bispinosa]
MKDEVAVTDHVNDEETLAKLWWIAPPLGSTKLNVDKSLCRSSHIMYARGIMRNSAGHIMYTTFQAELLAVRKGLKLAWDKGYL